VIDLVVAGDGLAGGQHRRPRPRAVAVAGRFSGLLGVEDIDRLAGSVEQHRTELAGGDRDDDAGACRDGRAGRAFPDQGRTIDSSRIAGGWTVVSNGFLGSTFIGGPSGDLCARGESEFREDVLDVTLCGSLRYDKGRGDFLVAHSSSDQVSDLPFPSGQQFVFGLVVSDEPFTRHAGAACEFDDLIWM
jgi:hypothetical protein